jgi:peroxiredoxin Q/BCP
MHPGTNGHSFVLVGPDGLVRWRADYGGPPRFSMYIPIPNLLADMSAGLAARS